MTVAKETLPQEQDLSKWQTVGEAILAYQVQSGRSEGDLQKIVYADLESWKVICDTPWDKRKTFLFEPAEEGHWEDFSGFFVILRQLEQLNPSDFKPEDLIQKQIQNVAAREILELEQKEKKETALCIAQQEREQLLLFTPSPTDNQLAETLSVNMELHQRLYRSKALYRLLLGASWAFFLVTLFI